MLHNKIHPFHRDVHRMHRDNYVQQYEILLLSYINYTVKMRAYLRFTLYIILQKTIKIPSVEYFINHLIMLESFE